MQAPGGGAGAGAWHGDVGPLKMVLVHRPGDEIRA